MSNERAAAMTNRHAAERTPLVEAGKARGPARLATRRGDRRLRQRPNDAKCPETRRSGSGTSLARVPRVERVSRPTIEEEKQMNASKMKIVYVISERNQKSFWNRIGVAFVNNDGSINVKLDAMPVSGELQIRDYVAREDTAGPFGRRNDDTLSEVA
jgi:hypothetical protein